MFPPVSGRQKAPRVLFIEEKDGINRLILGAGGDMVLSKRREESFQLFSPNDL